VILFIGGSINGGLMKKFLILPFLWMYYLNGMGCLPQFEHFKHKLCHKAPCATARLAIMQGDERLLRAHLCSRTINKSDERGETLGDYILDEAPKDKKSVLLQCLLRKGFNPFLSIKNRVSLVERIIAIHNVPLFRVLTIRSNFKLNELYVKRCLLRLVSFYPHNNTIFASFVRKCIADYWAIKEVLLNETYNLIQLQVRCSRCSQSQVVPSGPEIVVSTPEEFWAK
jgi:hypothetical protein